MAQLLGAEVDGTPHQAGEGIVLGAVAGPQPAEAGTGQRCCPALGFAPPPKKPPVLGHFAVGCSSLGWVLTHPACGRKQPPPHPAPRRLQRARSRWRRSAAGGQPTGQSTSPSASCSVLGGSSPPPTWDGVCRILPIKSIGHREPLLALALLQLGVRQLCSSTGGGNHGPAQEGFGQGGHQPQDASPTSAPAPSPQLGEGRPKVLLPPAPCPQNWPFPGCFQKTQRGNSPVRQGMGRDGAEDARGMGRDCPQATRVLQQSPCRCPCPCPCPAPHAALLPRCRGRRHCRARLPPARGGPWASIALLQRTMAPLSEQLTQPTAKGRQRKAENTATAKDNFNALL